MLNIGENFLLETHFAQELYREHAQRMAVIDYHQYLDGEQPIPMASHEGEWRGRDLLYRDGNR